MPRFSSRCKIAVLFLLVMVLLTPWASASENRGRAEPRAWQPWGLLDRVWEVVSSLWTKAGASPDPNGNPGSQPVPATGSTTNSDAGGSLDPNG